MMSFFQSLVFLVFGFLSVSDASIKDYTYPVKNFTTVWNVPTEMCIKHGVKFETETAKFGITANPGDKFRGDVMAIFYDPGKFPMMLKDKDNGNLVEQNGVIPQNGDVDSHLKEFESALGKVLGTDFSGLGVLDFEAWRPNWRQHWNDQTLYTNKSQELEANKNSNLLLGKDLEAAAKQSFETAARTFMEETLKKAKDLYPGAAWGYYGFPHCYNYKNDEEPECPKLAKDENDELGWLWQESTGLYPSIYIPSTMNATEYEKLIKGRLDEVDRIAKSTNKFIPTFPYFWYKFNDDGNFLSKEHTQTALKTIKDYEMGGVIIWGSSDNVSSKEKCEALLKHLNDILGPAVQELNRSSQAEELGEVVN